MLANEHQPFQKRFPVRILLPVKIGVQHLLVDLGLVFNDPAIKLALLDRGRQTFLHGVVFALQ